MVLLLILVVHLMNLIVAMDHVSMVHGHVTAGVTVQTALMKLTVVRLLVKTKVYGTVVMANVFQHHLYVMDHLSSVMQVGGQTVLMAQMKV